MQYISTRGIDNGRTFQEAILGGLAEDKGLYLPKQFPTIGQEDWQELRQYNYQELLAYVLMLFSDGAIPENHIKNIAKNTTAEFLHPDIAPVVPLRENLHVLELFHGPTLAFKDFALQTLAELFAHFLGDKQRLVVIGATSGDTGSAAIHACKNLEAIELFMLHPLGRTSEVQRLQMTTVRSANIHNIAIDGSFDDCQRIVKTLLHDQNLQEIAAQYQASLSAVNSINWGRILSQIVYYLYAALKAGAPRQAVNFAVPSGNFGNIFAAFVAKKMGLPVQKLIIATNHNDILARIQKNGHAKIEAVIPSYSPSMDIQVSSNFERLVYLLSGGDSSLTRGMFAQQEREGSIHLSSPIHKALQEHFHAFTLSDEETLKAMQEVYKRDGMIVDPHTVIAIKAAEQAIQEDPLTPTIALATAHPAKFADTVQKAIEQPFNLPQHVKKLYNLPEACTKLPSETETVFSYIKCIISQE